MMKKIIIFLTFITLFSCKTTRTPIVYDKDIDMVEKEVEIIQIMLNNGNYQKAGSELEKNLKLFPDNQELLELKGWLLLKLRKYDESEKLFLKILDVKDKNPHAHAALARIYRITGDNDKAIEYVEQGISLLPTISILWFEKGLLEYEVEEYKKALVDFTKAYSLDNTNFEAYFFKYLTMLLTGRDLNEVKHYWEYLVKNRLAKDWFYLYHSDVLFKLDLKTDAIMVAKSGLNFFPGNSYLLNILAYFLYDRYNEVGNEDVLEEAYSVINKCFSSTNIVEPGFVDTYLLILEAKNEKEKIKETIEKYHLIYPDSQELLKWIKKYPGI